MTVAAVRSPESPASPTGPPSPPVSGAGANAALNTADFRSPGSIATTTYRLAFLLNPGRTSYRTRAASPPTAAARASRPAAAGGVWVAVARAAT